MNIAKTELVEYKKDRQNRTKKWVYELSHSNKKTTLEQDFIIIRDQFGRLSADVKLLDFPVFHDKKEVAGKMADWLQRLSWAIQSGIKNGVFDD